jgi:hypothetical protein
MDYNLLSISEELRSGIYILQRDDHKNTKIFKVGRTDAGIFTRFSNGYKKESVLYYYCPVKNTISTETFILNSLRNDNNIKYRHDIGYEYFETEYDYIYNIVKNLTTLLKVEHNYNIDELIDYCNKNHSIISPKQYKKEKDNNIQIANDTQIEDDTVIDSNIPFICKRCKYETTEISNMYRHLKRKNICKALFNDISTDELINEFKQYDKSEVNYNGEKVFKCKYCEKVFNSRSSKCNHHNICRGKQYYEKIQLLTSSNKELEDKYKVLELENNKLKDKLNKLQMIINE